MLKSDRMPSSLEFMIAALAASSVVGASTRGVGALSPEIGVPLLEVGSSALMPFVLVTGAEVH
jgi:hypothetical protein